VQGIPPDSAEGRVRLHTIPGNASFSNGDQNRASPDPVGV